MRVKLHRRATVHRNLHGKRAHRLRTILTTLLAQAYMTYHTLATYPRCRAVGSTSAANALTFCDANVRAAASTICAQLSSSGQTSIPPLNSLSAATPSSLPIVPALGRFPSLFLPSLPRSSSPTGPSDATICRNTSMGQATSLLFESNQTSRGCNDRTRSKQLFYCIIRRTTCARKNVCTVMAMVVAVLLPSACTK